MFNERNSRFSVFNQRIITSNYFAKETFKGAKIPFFISDFFQFGETIKSVEDKLYSRDLILNYDKTISYVKES